MYKEEFAQRIRKARIDAGYTQEQVCEITKISQPIMSNLELGKRKPSLENLCKLIDLYEVSADWVLGTGMKKRE